MLFKDNCLFYYRYVDDICAALHVSEVDAFFNAFNSFHPRLQFTLEVGDNSLNSLDTSIIIKDHFLIFDWYRKPTFSGRFLNFHSNHPIFQKEGIIFNLVDRALMLSDFDFHSKNITFIIDTLIKNDYPIKFIFECINNRIKVIIHNNLTGANISFNSKEPFTDILWFTVPYVPVLTEKFKQFDRNDIKVSFFSSNKLNKYIKVQKDRVDSLSKSNVVYKINCKDCDASYVGQTGRRLKTRICRTSQSYTLEYQFEVCDYRT
ncbi:hypothetical protein ALC57_16619 [Trachymyrmex cornetzi]|uniref:Helix-turn-helix domain-containing protein n=1 Tax=Trachymyrmex cornetzi TaxID=471704 RepID=A0A151IUT1_9HYME|nr:hypothetical protein ALC57_16619 [Trachymyrmex cornetzi]